MKHLLLVLAVLASLTAVAINPETVTMVRQAPKSPACLNAKLINPDSRKSLTPAQNTQSFAEETFYTVKCYWDYAPDEWQPSDILAYNDDHYESVHYMPWDEDGNKIEGLNYIEIKVPAGTYDFMGFFYHLTYSKIYEGNVADYQAYPILENVTVASDMELKIDPTFAINEYSFEPKIPTGESFMPSEYYVTEDYDMTLRKEGNVDGPLSFDTLILYKGKCVILYNLMCTSIIYTDDSPIGRYNPFKESMFKVSDVSDNYTFVGMVRTFDAAENGGILYALGGTTHQGDHTITNDPSTYRNYGVDCQYTPLGVETESLAAEVRENDPYSGGLFSVIPWLFVDNKSMSTSGWEGPYDKYLKYSVSNDALTDNVIGIANQVGIYEYWKTDDDISYALNECAWVNLLGDDTPSLASFGLNWLSAPNKELPGNTVFNSPVVDIEDTGFATSPAAISYYLKGLWGENMSYQLTLMFNGRLNEQRNSDKAVTSAKLTVDGTVIGDVKNPDDANYYVWQNGASIGKVEMSWDNTNFEVEGQSGGNRGTVYFDAKGNDSFPPSLTMLQFRDESGAVNSVLEDGSKAELRLSAADLQCYEINDSFAFDPLRPEVVTVEMAPTGSEDFTRLMLTEHPDAFYAPGFGSYYTSSLADAKAEGWYDLRVYVEDAAGNYQRQTISHAFKIGRRSGIESPESVDVDASVEYFNLQGMRVANPAAGQLLIRRCGDKADKVIF